MLTLGVFLNRLKQTRIASAIPSVGVTERVRYARNLAEEDLGELGAVG